MSNQNQTNQNQTKQILSFLIANPSTDDIATIRRSIELNQRTPHHIFSNELKQVMKITKKTITLKEDVVLVCLNGQLLIPTYNKLDGFWRLKYIPNDLETLMKNIGITFEESMYFDFMNNNNYTFTPNQHMLMIVELN